LKSEDRKHIRMIFYNEGFFQFDTIHCSIHKLFSTYSVRHLACKMELLLFFNTLPAGVHYEGGQEI